MSSLFDYIKAIDEIIANNTDEDGVIAEEVLAELDALEVAKEEKIDNCISFIKSREAMAEMLKKERQAIAKREKTAENEVERVKQYLTFCLAGAKWESTAGKVSYRRSEAVEVEDLDEIPAIYKTEVTEVKADKKAIKEAIKNGYEVPGARLEERQSTVIK